jgi:DNA polymerase
MPDRLYQECRSIISGSRAILEDLRSAGIDTIATDLTSGLSGEGQAGQADGTLRELAAPDRLESLEQIRQQLNSCLQCPLHQHRQTLVFGVGNPQARLVLVGEAPGAQEDRVGEPFVGEAGQLLDRILFAMKLRREDVYVCNVIKCRPPGNRDPQYDEIAACETFLQRQLKAIAPEIILCLGRVATQALLKTDDPISKLRGRWQNYEGIPLMPTFHPAYLLRNPASKHMVWEDVKQVMHRLQSG